MFRAVFDTNIIIAALKSRSANSPSRELLQRWEAGEFDLLYSRDLQTEYEETAAARDIDPSRARGFFSALTVRGVLIEVRQITPVVVADPDDDVVLACAVAGQATHLVTYDPHLLNLGNFYLGIRLLDGLHFLYALRGDIPSGN